MIHDLLVHLAKRYAFDATPAFADLGVYHVPFDSMPNLADHDCLLVRALAVRPLDERG